MQVRRVREAVEALGQPLPPDAAARLDEALRLDGPGDAVRAIQEALDPVWVTVGGQPVRASRDSAAWCLDAVDVCREQKRGQDREAELDEARAASEHARAAYRRIRDECAGR